MVQRQATRIRKLSKHPEDGRFGVPAFRHAIIRIFLYQAMAYCPPARSWHIVCKTGTR